MPTSSVTVKQTIKASCSQIYQAFTNATALRGWLCDGATVSPHPGGRFFLWWNDGNYNKGEYTALELDHLVEFTWQGPKDLLITLASVTLESQGQETLVTIVHRDLEDLPDDRVQRMEADWQRSLENLSVVLEDGQDPRITRRPMLGIHLGNAFTAETAARLGVPVKEGIRLEDVMEGMGAQKAGLRRDDVIVSLNDKPVKDYATLATALRGVRGGDMVNVTFYRGPEKKQTSMELSHRPIAIFPSDPKELASMIRSKQNEAMACLEPLFKDVTEEAADRHPAPGEWSAKDTLAHLILSERQLQVLMMETIENQERISDEPGDNVEAAIQATVAVYPTIPELIDQLKRSLAESIEIINNLPPSFLSRKGSYWSLALTASSWPEHIAAHYDQISNAVK